MWQSIDLSFRNSYHTPVSVCDTHTHKSNVLIHTVCWWIPCLTNSGPTKHMQKGFWSLSNHMHRKSNPNFQYRQQERGHSVHQAKRLFDKEQHFPHPSTYDGCSVGTIYHKLWETLPSYQCDDLTNDSFIKDAPFIKERDGWTRAISPRMQYPTNEVMVVQRAISPTVHVYQRADTVTANNSTKLHAACVLKQSNAFTTDSPLHQRCSIQVQLQARRCHHRMSHLLLVCDTQSHRSHHGTVGLSHSGTTAAHSYHHGSGNNLMYNGGSASHREPRRNPRGNL